MKQKKAVKNNDTTLKTDQNSAPNSGVTSFFYKFTELAAYTTSAFSTISDTLSGGATEHAYPVKRSSYDDDDYSDVMQINADDSDGAYDDEISDGEIDAELSKKKQTKWSANDDDEEPPPPYDSSWTMPKTNPGASNTSKNISVETPDDESKSTSSEDTKSATTPQTVPRRRQIRVRRPRKLYRRKSTEVSTPRSGSGKCDDPEKLLLKVNDKLSDMIAQGRAALTSTVDITEVDMLLAEEKEREERIMKNLGVNAPAGRKGRKSTSDYDYFNPISSPEYFDYGYAAYGDHGSGFVPPSGYETPTYTSHGHYNTPFDSPTYQTKGGFNYSNLGYGVNNHHKFPQGGFNPIPNQYYGDPAIPKGFGAGPLSSGFVGPAKFGGRYRHNSGFSHGFGSNSSGFGSNVFVPTGGHRANGVYNNNREFSY